MKIFILSILAVMGFSTAFSQSKGQMDNRINESAIPKDILSKEYVLLVKIPYDTKTWISKFTKVMEEHYSGSFEIVPYDTHIDDNYSDIKKYRFILALPNSLSKKDFKGANAEIANDKKGIAPTSAWSKHFHIADRRDLSEYWNTNLSGQNTLKILGYLADRLSGKEGKE